MQVHNEEVKKVLAEADLIYTQAQIESALDQMAIDIGREMGDARPVVMPVMSGALITAGYLLPRLPFDIELDYVHASRYNGDIRGKDIVWHKKPATDLKDKTVLVIDDILDEGDTLAAIIDYCQQQGAQRVLSAVLVDKSHDRKHPQARVEFIALTVEDRYVFGYGMDYKNHLRNLPAIYAVKK